MVRKQIYIRPDQEALLKRVASRAGTSQAELIRGGLDRALRGTVGPLRDPAAWERLKVAMIRRSQVKSRPARRRWTREELYDRTILR